MDQAIQKGARSDHHCPGLESNPGLCDRANHAIPLNNQVIDGLLEKPKIRLILKTHANSLSIEHTVGLGTGRPDRRTLAGVEDPKLNASLVCRRRHRAAKRVDFLDQMTFSDAANRGIARHLAEGFDVVGQQQSADTHPRRR